MTNDNKDKKRDIAPSQVDTSSIEVITTTVGDKDKKYWILEIYQEQALPKE
jgi:hypothetical protein